MVPDLVTSLDFKEAGTVYHNKFDKAERGHPLNAERK
jgi:hypothetical protein